MTTPTPTQRRARARAIRDAALVRAALGQTVGYELVDGEHVVTYRGERYIGPMIDAVVGAAQEGDL